MPRFRRSAEEASARSRWMPRLAAVCELVGVLLVSIVIQRAAMGALGIPSWKGMQAEMLDSGQVDFLALSVLAAIDLLLRYGVLLGLAFAIGWWHRRRRLEDYGVTLAGHGWRELVGIGVVLWGVGAALPRLLQALADHVPWIGEGPDHWALFPSTWTAEFLLYLAVSSFLLVPIVEELWARGYILNRLREDFGDAGALMLSAVFFALVHMQYFKAEVLSIGMSLSLVIGSLAAGYVLLRTGSLVPCIVAHALANLPTPPGEWSEEIVFALAVAVLLVARRSVLRWGSGCLTLLRGNPEWGGTLFGLVVLLVVLGAVLVLQNQAAGVAVALLLIGIGGDALDRRAR